MKKILLGIIISVILFGCKQNAVKNDETLEIPESIIDIPFYSVGALFYDNNTLVLNLIDSAQFHNPTVFIQALNWYTYQISCMDLAFDSLRINYSMPIRDSIPNVHTNQVNRDYVNRIHSNLNNTLFADFQEDLFKLNWETKSNYVQQQSSLMDRINALFARNIDTSAYKNQFPNNDTWFGIDCFKVFELYFYECLNQERSTGHQIIEHINKSTKYFNERDREDLVSLIEKYSLKVEELRSPIQELNGR